MTGSPAPPTLLLSDKLMAINNLSTRVPVVLDVDEMNYASWTYFFQNLVRGYNLLDHIISKPVADTATSSSLSPPTDEWIALDTIILSWIFSTSSKNLQQRLVVENPKTAKEAWDILSLIFNDNKRSRSIALKAELRSMKLGDLSIDAYFRKIETIAIVLSSLGSPISNDDVVNIALDGLPDKYNHVSDIIIHRDPFLDLKTVRSMLTTAEMRLKSRAPTTYVDGTSSSPMVLLTNSGNNTRRSTPMPDKIYKPCINFDKGSCRFGAKCRFLHGGIHGNASVMTPTGNPSLVSSCTNLTNIELTTLQGLLAKLGTNNTPRVPQITSPMLQSNTNTPIACYVSPPGFGTQAQAHFLQTPIHCYGGNSLQGVQPTQGVQVLTSSQQPGVQTQQGGSFFATGVQQMQQGVQQIQQGVHPMQGGSYFATRVQQPPGGSVSQHPGVQTMQGGSFLAGQPPGQLPGQETLLPSAFNAVTLQAPIDGNWNMDTGVSNASGAAPL